MSIDVCANIALGWVVNPSKLPLGNQEVDDFDIYEALDNFCSELDLEYNYPYPDTPMEVFICFPESGSYSRLWAFEEVKPSIFNFIPNAKKVEEIKEKLGTEDNPKWYLWALYSY